jgi:hypothetical protein
VVIVAIVVVAVSCLPYLVGYLFTPPGRVFGGFVLDVVDSNAYLAKMQQGAQGHWKAVLLHTPEDHPALRLYVFYLALGHLAAWLGLPLILVYHAARVVCGLILLIGLYMFLGLFLKSRRVRWVAYLLAAIGSGIGWLIILVAGNPALGGVSPLDFWLMEAYVFFTLFLFPQSALAMALLMGGLGGMVRYFERGGGWRPWLFALGCGLFLALINPYVLLVAGAVLAGYWLAVWIARAVGPANGLLCPTVLLTPSVAQFPGPRHRALATSMVLCGWLWARFSAGLAWSVGRAQATKRASINADRLACCDFVGQLLTLLRSATYGLRGHNSIGGSGGHWPGDHCRTLDSTCVAG